MNKSNKTFWVIGATVLLIIAGGVWFFTKGSTSPSENTGPVTTTSETSGPGAVTVKTSTGTVAQVVAQVTNGGTFAAYLASTGVGATLTGKGPYTIFVSTDGAFSRLTPGTITNMTAAQKKRMVQYHVVAGKSIDIDAVNNGQIQALSRDALNFNVDGGKVYVNSGYVLDAYKASNGMVYVINAVLLPPTSTFDN